jgi:LPS-assembly lipoprotein
MATRRDFVVLALGLPALLAGCGWEPLYANRDTEAAGADLRAIRVYPIPDRVGQRLELALRTALNPSNEPAKQLYLLRVTVSTALSDLGVQSQGLGTRGDAHLYATYRLTEITSNKLLQTSSIHTIESFDIQANGYSTVVAEDDAYARNVEEVRREIIARLTTFMQNRKATAAS